jgi:hypothetical protein
MPKPIEIEKDGSLSIDTFQQGIGNSSLSNFADIMGVNVTDNPGVASVNFKFNNNIKLCQQQKS